MKETIAETLREALEKIQIKLSTKRIIDYLENPPSFEMGDFAFPCFFLSKKLKKSPHEIALEIRKEIGNIPKEFYEINVSGPYINFVLNRKEMALKLIKEVQKKKNDYGSFKTKKISMVEFPSPNTNKPLHVGHLRNMSIGESVSRILEFAKGKVIRTNLNNDRGIHICKSMLAYEKWGKNKKPPKNKKSDHFVGDFYVKFSKNLNEKLKEQAQEMLQKWEQGDKKTFDLWKKMNNWALKGFKETYKRFGIKHDKEYFESNIYSKGKGIIQEGLKNKIFQEKKDGSVFIDLEKEGLGEKIVLRPDGTSLYITQDLYLAKKKFEDFKLDNSIYIVGNEQDYHFKVLKEILNKLSFSFSNKIHHLSYGMVELPEGKMKSREGKVVDADDLIEKVQSMVKKELKSRAENKKISKRELEKRSLKIALASIKYLLLRTSINKNMMFDPKKSIDFEGNTGSYLLYTYARASSILRKVKKPNIFHIKEVSKKERELVMKLSQFKNVFWKSHKELNPSLIANYVYELSKLFNEFYHQCPVMNSEHTGFRYRLVESFKQVSKNSLWLLGIEPLEKM